MKRFFHVSALVLLTGAFISCSKSSSDELQANAPAQQSMARSRQSANPNEGWTKVFPEITTPRLTVLGNPDSYLYGGDQAVFYVILAAETTSDSYTGTIVLRDAGGNVIQTFNMLPDTDPGAGGLILPEEIAQNGHRYLFVPIDIDAQYIGMTVTIETTVQQPNGDTSVATIPAAFTVL